MVNISFQIKLKKLINMFSNFSTILRNGKEMNYFDRILLELLFCNNKKYGSPVKEMLIFFFYFITKDHP
jgi:hypothetical protein